MNWRTDKPTADVIVALLTREFCTAEWHNRYALLSRYDEPEVHYGMENILDAVHTTVPFDAIEKWADLEEDETVTKINQPKRKGKPRKVYEYPVEVPNNDGCLVFVYMKNSTIRKKLRLKKGERAIISIRKEI